MLCGVVVGVVCGEVVVCADEAVVIAIASTARIRVALRIGMCRPFHRRGVIVLDSGCDKLKKLNWLRNWVVVALAHVLYAAGIIAADGDRAKL